jgi:NADH-quinone oxidoreductase subunit L
MYWLIGAVTAFMTSFYMFRLLYMTFFGDYRGAQEESHGHGHDAHGHGGPHESPPVMLVPLMILALLSLVGGLVGIGNHFENFLAPVFSSGLVSETVETAGRWTEILLMAVSVGLAFLGWWLAYVLYYKRPELPQEIADALGGLYETVVHKYYVDEIYAALFVRPLIDGSTRILWQDVDRKIIDAAVNDAGEAANHVSDEVRHMQSGNIRSYAAWIAAGSGLVIAFMIWMGVR